MDSRPVLIAVHSTYGLAGCITQDFMNQADALTASSGIWRTSSEQGRFPGNLNPIIDLAKVHAQRACLD